MADLPPIEKGEGSQKTAEEYSRSQWFNPELDNLSESTRHVLETYSKIPSDQVVPHVFAVRAKAWAVRPYPCIGQWRFLNLAIGQHKFYQSEILPRMLTGKQTYLDLGCAFAQDIRRLVADGVDSRQCYGSDLQLDFIELGYELFKDKETLKSRFIDADVFDTNSPLKDLEGQIDIVDASSFFHLFPYDQQVIVARRVATLLRPQKDSLVVGRQVGTDKPSEVPRRDGQGSRFRHNIATWRKMWEDVGAETGVEYEVHGFMGQIQGAQESQSSGNAMMEFSVRRLT